METKILAESSENSIYFSALKLIREEAKDNRQLLGRTLFFLVSLKLSGSSRLAKSQVLDCPCRKIFKRGNEGDN